MRAAVADDPTLELALEPTPASARAPDEPAVGTGAWRRPARSSDGQALAAFGPAGADDGSPATGLHANQESVGALAADHRGLIRAFHGCSRFRKKPAITSIAAPPVNVC